jgi:hypothetical protein
MPKNNLVSKLMNEQINLGGQLVTRAECYQILMAEHNNPQMADYFAFGREAEKDIDRFCAVCTCGARWQGVVPVMLNSCPACKEEECIR